MIEDVAFQAETAFGAKENVSFIRRAAKPTVGARDHSQGSTPGELSVVHGHFHAALIARRNAPAGHSHLASRGSSGSSSRHVLEGPILRDSVRLLGWVGYLVLQRTQGDIHREITQNRQDADHGKDSQRMLGTIAGKKLVHVKLYKVLPCQVAARHQGRPHNSTARAGRLGASRDLSAKARVADLDHGPGEEESPLHRLLVDRCAVPAPEVLKDIPRLIAEDAGMASRGPLVPEREVALASPAKEEGKLPEWNLFARVLSIQPFQVGLCRG